MKLFLAGYNVDAEVLEELKSTYPKQRDDVTPETISAAYARISRDPRPVNELRQVARGEVEKSRKSNQSIIFNLGHSSVAEHAVFNFDLLGVSRLAMEEIEKFRLCSFTEKSQRYITLGTEFTVPPELKGSRFEQEFQDVVKRQCDYYQVLFDRLKDYVYEQHKDLAADPKNHNLLEGWAKEDARYITPLATHAQVGMTLNARNLEKMIRRFASHPLREVQTIGQALHTLVKDIAPSIVKYPEANDFDKRTYPEVQDAVVQLLGKKLKVPRNPKAVQLLDYSRQADDRLLAGFIYRSSVVSFKDALKRARRLSDKQRLGIFQTAVRHMHFYDQVVREFELIDVTYDLTLSAACFGQLKRHRMATIITQRYEPRLGLKIPGSIHAIGLTKEFTDMARTAEDLYNRIKAEVPTVAEYILTNAHQRKVLFKTNLRALYHISRLREDAHAQWDIRELAAEMSKQAAKVMPLAASFIGGKDRFDEMYRSVCQ
jgi:flavin-dependent thymidylate synthase